EALLRGYAGILDVRRDMAADSTDIVDAAAASTPTPLREALAPPIESPLPAEAAPKRQHSLTLVVDYAGDERGMGELLTLLISNGVLVTRFAEQSSDLQDIFMQVTKGIVQ